MGQTAPVLKLDDIVILSKRNEPEIQCCHTYGIFKDETTATSKLWHLTDDTCRDISFRLCGALEEYPLPKPGDIVRIHRVSFDRNTKSPVILCGKNIVIWRGFRENPTPITKAKSPTITEDDAKRRKALEIYHESTIVPVELIARQTQGCFFTISGQIEDVSTDQYGNSLFKFRDGTGRFLLRVFPKRNEVETNIHFENASKLVVGDFIVATSVALDRATASKVNLSANIRHGRYLNKVEPNSYLGRKLFLAIEDAESKNGHSDGAAAPTVATEAQKRPAPEGSQPLRRSPRLNGQQADSSVLQVSPSQDAAAGVREDPQVPEYTRISEIPMSGPTVKFSFYDLAGQVRGQPNETSNYGNWVFQLYDGSRPEYSCHYAEEVKEKEAHCVTILVFSKQTQKDTDQHIEVVKKLKSGDLVFVKNVKATWIGEKLKLEMSANLAHGKSITVIDKTTRFGEMLDDVVSNPISPDESFHDATLDY